MPLIPWRSEMGMELGFMRWYIGGWTRVIGDVNIRGIEIFCLFVVNKATVCAQPTSAQIWSLENSWQQHLPCCTLRSYILTFLKMPLLRGLLNGIGCCTWAQCAVLAIIVEMNVSLKGVKNLTGLYGTGCSGATILRNKAHPQIPHLQPLQGLTILSNPRTMKHRDVFKSRSAASSLFCVDSFDLSANIS